MAFSLEGSVGRGGRNLRPDTEKIQNALNKVPPDSGRASPPLVVDGLCGPLTTDAIQKFQLRQFGWKGADGRVDVLGPTHQKLNEYDSAPPTGPAMPLPAPNSSQSFSICVDSGPTNLKSRDREWLVRITDEANVESRLFRLRQYFDWQKESPAKDWGTAYYFSVDKPITLDGFDSAAMGWVSILQHDPSQSWGAENRWLNTMSLRLKGETVQTDYYNTPPCIAESLLEAIDNKGKPGLFRQSVKGRLEMLPAAAPLAMRSSGPRWLSPDRAREVDGSLLRMLRRV